MRGGAAEELDGEWGAEGDAEAGRGEQEDHVEGVCRGNLDDRERLPADDQLALKETQK